MIDLKQNTLQRELPDNLLVDKKVFRLAQSLQKSLDRRLKWADKINYTTKLDLVDDEIISHLLWEKHIGYDEGLALASTREEKNKLLRNAVELHRRKGTPSAIELALRAVGLKGEVAEWFETDSEPYHFLVELHLNQKLSDLDLIKAMIMEYKNVRSWFDGFVVLVEGEGIVWIDDTYNYPVFYPLCGQFWGRKEFTQVEVGELKAIDDTYNYPVSYPVTKQGFTSIKGGKINSIDDTYRYKKEYRKCGEMMPLDKKVTTSTFIDKIINDAYGFKKTYRLCGQFSCEG